MYQVPQITDSIYYVGVNDRMKALFENMWSLPQGVAYNAYLIVDEQTTLIDTVDVCYSDIFFHKLDLILQGRPLDYLIINHMEPDHGGSIGLLRKRYPELKIVGNKKTFEMLRGFHGITEGLHEVKNGDALSIGGHEFSFLMAPMVHWPEVMFTYEQRKRVLFTADAFGSFGALDGILRDSELGDRSAYLREMERYYACVIGKYGPFVQKALANMDKQGLTIDHLCPAHGVVWTPEGFGEARRLYDRLSRFEAEDGVVILYGSMYGNTEQLADVIAQSLSAAGIKRIVCHNVSKSDPSAIRADVFRYRGLIIGSNSFGKGTVQTMVNLNEFVTSNTPSLGSMKFTMAMFHRVNGSSTQFRGVTPDVSLPSLFPPEEVGEQAEDYALPWKEIKAAKITPAGKIADSTINTLRQLHETRMLGKAPLRRYQEYIDKILEKNRQKTWPLNLAERKREHENWKKYQDDYEAAQRRELPLLNADKKKQEEIAERNAAVEDEDDKENFVPDVALFETLNIFYDYLELLAPPAVSAEAA